MKSQPSETHSTKISAEGPARGYVLGLTSQAWHLVTAFTLYALLARSFGTKGFGDWRLALSVLSWFEIAVTSSVANSAVKAIPAEPDDAPAIGRAAYLGQFGLGLGAFLLMQLAAGPIAAALRTPGLEPLLRVAAFDLPVFALMIAASAYLLGTGRFQRQAIGWMVYATSKALLIGALGAGMVSVTGAFVGNALASVAGLAALAVPLAGPVRRIPSLTTRAMRLVVAAPPFLAIALLAGLNMSSDLWLVGALSDSRTQVGLFAAAAILAEIPVFLFIGLNRVVFPRVAAAHTQGDFAARDANTLMAVRVAMIVSVMGVAIAAFGGRPLLAFVFSASYADAAVPLAWLMVAALGRTVLSTACEVLTARDRMWLAIGSMAITGIAQVAAVIALAPAYGITGAAIGAAAASILGATITVLALSDSVGMHPLGTLARSAAAAAIAASPLALTGDSPAVAVAVLALSSVLYAVLLVVTREVRRADLAALGLIPHHRGGGVSGPPSGAARDTFAEEEVAPR